MSFKSDLQSNNTDLQGILATINSLPDAGGGSGGGASVETCTVTIVSEGVGNAMTLKNCVDAQVVSTTTIAVKTSYYKKDGSVPITSVVKGSLVHIKCPNVASISGEGITVKGISTTDGFAVLEIKSNAPDTVTITLSSGS